jgi:hypothetical protein
LINRDSKRGGGIRGGLALFLECVLLPTLPHYRSDTSISFFSGGQESSIGGLRGTKSPWHNSFPLSKSGEGDIGGEVDKERK